jgi:DNA-directed RNA polymerase subunit RPC12/RpoP
MDKTTAELVLALKAWREAHPTATLVEIETTLDAELSKARAEMLTEMAQASRATEAETAAGAEVKCPECGGRTRRQGYRKRKLVGPHDEVSVLRRRYVKCVGCGHTFSPSGQ